MNKFTCPIYRVLWLFSLLLLISMNLWSTQTTPIESEDEAIETAFENLPLEGRLKQAPDGYVYLKIPDKVVRRLFPLVREAGFYLPHSIRRHTRIGAHISVMYKKEAAPFRSIPELGKAYAFVPQRIRHVRSGAKEYIILEVDAPQLEKMREHYGLSAKLMNHEFHITVAEKELN